MNDHNEQLIDMMVKYNVPYNLKRPVRMDKIKYPFMIVFYRKKISLRNSKYLALCVIRTFSDYSNFKRNLKHKGWGLETMLFDLSKSMEHIRHDVRMIYKKYQNWDDLGKDLSNRDRSFIPMLKQKYPCPETQLKDKKGQYKIIM